jgi:hypothetical protein
MEAKHQFTRDDLTTGVKLTTGSTHRITVVGGPVLARVFGKAFATNRSLLLSGAAKRMTRIRAMLTQLGSTELLIVGHCDTTGQDRTNDPLSLERAQTTLAFIKDDKQAWLDMFGDKAPAGRRWADPEDQELIKAAAGFESRPEGQDPVRWFQETRGLEVDGIAGPITRAKLIEEYMALDGEAFADAGLDVAFTPHGCGEHFPLDDDGRDLDAAPRDDFEDPLDRRVEFFFFPKKTGIQPPPPGPNSRADSPEYPIWRQKSRLRFETVVVDGEDDLFIRFHIDPKGKSEIKDEFRLFSSDGAYDETKTIAKDAEVEADFVDLVFTRVLVDRDYTLEVTPTEGDVYFMFSNVPFSELDGFAGTDSGDVERDPLEPEPGTV